ncbi:MAG TPA: hypothetical protein VFC58_01480, partial [Desulfosporosinus sp.]|nr:hypothetical protein [Desulfosporosinus sp.]
VMHPLSFYEHPSGLSTIFFPLTLLHKNIMGSLGKWMGKVKQGAPRQHAKHLVSLYPSTTTGATNQVEEICY